MICAIVLAAGDSLRMSRPKPLLELNGKTFLEVICNNIRSSGLSDTTVVFGRYAKSIMLGWRSDGERVVINPEPEKGQISSLRTALKRLPADAESVLVALVDHPLVNLSTYRELMDCWKHNADSIVIPRFRGKRGHPVMLPRSVWPLCFEGPADIGLHWVIHHESVKVIDLEVNDKNILKDIDTPGDYKKIGTSKK